ncbi:FAD dependent oxidoreductase [Klenkia soli]|uniref:FAD dependent oxidoreductase n=1 Tax=Klenkia soli TaxID=1052260 RepID=A0A1H0Q0W5_9ACTN|nr:FAD dependent oxidoreductase [Klenkia soli]
MGLGVMGTAAAAHLAARRQRVLGLERLGPAHYRGSNKGGAWITRQAYCQDPASEPLLRAYELWDRSADDFGADGASLTGVFLDRPDSPTVAGSLLADR